MHWKGVACGLVVGLGVLIEGCAERFVGDQHWDVYGEFLYIKRDDLHSKTLVVNDMDATVMRSKNLLHKFDYEPGYRVGAVYAPNRRYGFEGVFSYLSPWSGTDKKADPGSLSFPFESPTYDPSFTDADYAQGYYKSSYWDAELNFWRYFTERRASYFAVSGLVGIRFFHLDELFRLTLSKHSDSSDYKIRTSNRLITGQLGLDFQMHPTKLLSWELLAKVGCFGNSTQQDQFLGESNNSVALRNSSTSKWQVGFVTDVTARLGLELLKWLELNVGYEVLYLTGLSLAPEQISYKVTPQAGKTDYTHGNIVLYGVVTGMTIRF